MSVISKIRRAARNLVGLRVGLALGVLAAGWFAAGQVARAQPEPTEASRASSGDSAERAIFAALDAPSRLPPGDRSLAELVDELFARHGIQARVDEHEILEWSNSDSLTIHIEWDGLPLDSVLRLALAPHELSLALRDETLQITTQTVAEEVQFCRVYPVGDLVHDASSLTGMAGAIRPARWPDFDSLIDLITSTLAPESWDAAGGPGNVMQVLGDSPAADAIVLAQTLEVHREIERFLAQLRAARRVPFGLGGAPMTTVLSMAPTKFTAAIDAALATRDDLSWQDVKLSEFARFLSRRFVIRAQLDVRTLDEAGIYLNEGVSASLKDCPLELAVRQALAAKELDLFIRWDVLHVTTRAVAEEEMEIRMYPVGDIVQVDGGLAGPIDGWSSGDSLNDAVAAVIDVNSWDDAGGPGAMYVFPGDSDSQDVLCASAIRSTHLQIERFLDDLRAARLAWHARRASGPFALFTPRDAEDAAQLERVLAAPARWQIDEEFRQGAGSLAKQIGMPVLCLAGSPNLSVHHAANGGPLGAELASLFAECGLFYEIRDGAILVEKEPAMVGQVQTLAWNVEDLRDFRTGPPQANNSDRRCQLARYLDDALVDAGAPDACEAIVLTALDDRPRMLVTRMPPKFAGVIQNALDRARGAPRGERPVHVLPLEKPGIEVSRRTYRLKGLKGQAMAKGDENYGEPGTAADVADLLTTMLEPETWHARGGRGQIEVERDALSIRQSGEMHAKVVAFLEALNVRE